MRLVIAKVNETLFDGEAASITVPGAAGELTILGEHMPLITTLKPGMVTVRSSEGVGTFAIDGGLLEVRRDGATIVL